MKKTYKGPERRKFLRLDYTTPLACKVCKKKTISNLFNGYIADVSQSGLRCKIKEKMKKGDILWLSFDRTTLHICEDLERKAFIYQQGIIGRVVWVKPKGKTTYEVGLQFVTRQEKNLTNIYPKINFFKQGDILVAEDEPEEEGRIEEVTEDEPMVEEE